MTDKEIIKAFEEKVNLIGTMTSVYLDEVEGLNLYVTMNNALGLINRQQAEIKRLKEKYDRTMTSLKAVLDERADHTEAIKEFADKLKSEMIGKFCSYFNGELTNAIIDKVLKEMVGEENDT